MDLNDKKLTKKQINELLDRMLSLGILSNYGKLYKLSDKFKSTVKLFIEHKDQWNLGDKFNDDYAKVLAMFEFSDLLNVNDISNFLQVIEIIEWKVDEK